MSPIMRARPRKLVARFILRAGILAAASAGLPIAIGCAWSQDAAPAPSLGLQEPSQSQPQQTPPRKDESPAASPRPENPGLINEIGKLFEKSLSVLPPLKTPPEAIDDLNARAKDAARDAGDTLSRLARPSSMVSGRTICPPAANGTADCKMGADKLCQSKGYKEGKSLNTDWAETCSAKVFIPGRRRKPDDCRTDNYVTAALCQ
jgi:hypothetical protein